MTTSTKLSDALTYYSPMDMMRHMVEAFDRCEEEFLDDKTIPQLINIYHCWMRCGWDIFPDQWETKQAREAMRGICPDWIETRTELKPVYHADRAETRKITAVSFVEHGGAAMIWIKCRERLPINGQDVWYYGPDIGVWSGRFEIDKTPEAESMRKQLSISTNLFVCDEALGVVDSDDAPYWMPREAGSDRPTAPEAT